MARALALRLMLIKAKRAGFTFRIFEGDAQIVVPADQVEIGSLDVTYSDENEERYLPCRRVDVQVLAESKTANVLTS